MILNLSSRAGENSGMTDTSSSVSVTIDVQETLRFFDEKPDWSNKHATGIVGVLGEDLNAACFQCYIESKGGSVAVLQDTVGTGGKKGPRLDRWITVDWSDGSKTVFQTEIKNWSAHAKGGKTLPVNAPSKEVADYKQRRWKERWDSSRRTLNDDKTAKVLVPMKPPSGLEERRESIRPLLIFWEAIGPRNKSGDHLFHMDKPTCDFPFDIPSTWPQPPYEREFPSLWVFSVSSYLRSIPDTTIELQMPNAVARLRIIESLFQYS